MGKAQFFRPGSLSLLFAVVFLVPWAAEASTIELTGRIAAVDGRPLTGFVEVLRFGNGIRSETYWTDAQGQFSIELPDGSRLLVVARAEGYISAERVIVPSADQHEIRLDFALDPAGRVSGRVIDESGQSVAGALVRVHYPDSERRLVYDHEAGNVLSDDFGYFELPYVAQARRFVLAVTRDDRLPAFSGALVLSRDSLDGVVLPLPLRGERVRLRVVDRGGVPVAGAMVRLQASGEAESYSAEQRQSSAFREMVNRRARTGAEGWVEFGGVPEGEVIVVAGRQGGKLTKVEALVQRGRVLESVVSIP